MKKQFRYAAFISYSHIDKKQAKWIQKKLESYALPKELQEDLGVEKHLAKCFRDEDDLSGTSLQKAIYKELGDSKYLIVVCSKNTPKSHYVNEEVKKFCEIRGKEYVIPFIIDGTPGATVKEDECYPKALIEAYSSEDSPLGYNIRELGKWKVVSKIVATLLGLSADYLLKRDNRRRRQQIYRRCGISVVASILLTYIICFVSYCWPKEEYYVDYVMQQGVPIGIGELSNQEVKEKATHYSIITKNSPEGLLFWKGSCSYEIRLENVTGALEEENNKVDQASWITCSFSNSGQYTMILRDEHEVEFATLKYSSDMLAMDITNPTIDSQAVVLSSDTTNDMFGLSDSIMTYGNISRKYYTYDEEGYVIKVEYMRDNRNTPVADSNGIYGEEYVLDDKNRIIETYFLNENGERFTLSTGVYCVETIYNEENLLVTELYYTENREMIYGTEDKVNVYRTYDENMNCSLKAYTDLDGNLKNGSNGYAKCVAVYEDGLCASLQFYTANETLIISSTQCTQVEITYDKNGRVSKEVYLDENGNCSSHGGYYAIRTFEYDNRGNIVEICFFDEEENAIEPFVGHSIVYQYDEDGNRIKKINLDSENFLTESIYENAYTEYEYEEGYLVGVSDYNVDDEMIYRAIYEYDTQTGNMVTLSYCDENGELNSYDFGHAVKKYEYDEYGHITKESYYNIQNELCSNSNGYSYKLCEYDNAGNCTKTAFYNEEDALTDVYSVVSNNVESAMPASGFYTMVTCEYDDRGNIIEQKYYGTNGELRTDGVSICKIQYDENNNMTRIDYFDEEEAPITFNGSASVCYEYDVNGWCTKYSYYDENNTLIVNSDIPYGVGILSGAVVKLSYDSSGNCIETMYYDENDALMITDDGYAIVRYEYNEYGTCIEEAYYDTDEKLIECNSYEGTYAIIKREYEYYNGWSLCTKESYYGIDEELRMQMQESEESGYAEIEHIYEDGLCIEENYYDNQGELVIQSTVNGTYACLKKQYEDGNCIETSYYDDKEQLLNQDDGYAVVRCEYDENGCCVEKAYYDENEELTMYKNSYAKIVTEYDEACTWKPKEEAYYDTENQLIDQEEGYAIISYQYNEDASCVEKSYYNQENQLVNAYINGTSYAKVVKEYEDGTSNCVMEAYYDENGALYNQSEGYAIVRYEYNIYDQCIKTSYYDQEDQPVVIDYWGTYYASMEKEYRGDSWYCSKESYYDQEGNPCIQTTYEGEAYTSKEYYYYGLLKVDTVYVDESESAAE